MASSTQKRPLIPHEHGAYAELLLPLTTGLALAGLSWPAWALALSVTAGFVAHESALVLVGTRGSRIQKEEGPTARRWLAVLGALALVLGALGFWGSPPEGRIALLMPLALALVLIPFILTRREKTLTGELLVIAGFASALVPIALAGGADLTVCVVAAVAWFAVFSTGTLAVMAVKARSKKGLRARWPLVVTPLFGTALVVVGVGLVQRGIISLPVMLTILLSVVAAVLVAVLPVPARRLRGVGWTLAGTSVVTWLGLVIGLG